jgi:hypothetical protein
MLQQPSPQELAQSCGQEQESSLLALQVPLPHVVGGWQSATQLAALSPLAAQQAESPQ